MDDRWALTLGVEDTYPKESDDAEVYGLRGLVELAASLRGRVHLQQGVDAVEAHAGHQLLRRQTLKLGIAVQFGDRGNVADAREALRRGVLAQREVGGGGETLGQRSTHFGRLLVVHLFVDDVPDAVVVVDGVDDHGRPVLVVGRQGEADGAILVSAGVDVDVRIAIAVAVALSGRRGLSVV